MKDGRTFPNHCWPEIDKIWKFEKLSNSSEKNRGALFERNDMHLGHAAWSVEWSSTIKKQIRRELTKTIPPLPLEASDSEPWMQWKQSIVIHQVEKWGTIKTTNYRVLDYSDLRQKLRNATWDLITQRQQIKGSSVIPWFLIDALSTDTS